MTAVIVPADVPEWLRDAVIGLLAAAYERGRADAAALAAEAAPVPAPDYLTRREAADRLRVSLTTVTGLIRTGALPSVTIGARRLVPLSAVTKYLATAST